MSTAPLTLDPARAEIITDHPHRAVRLLTTLPDLTVTWSRYAAGEAGPDLHVHREHTDAFFILAGELTFPLGADGEPVRVGAGGFVAAPPNVPHGFINGSDAEAQWLNFHAPDAGFAAYLRGARDGAPPAWDSFDPPADGGRPATEVLLVRPDDGPLDAAIPGLRVCEHRPGTATDFVYTPAGVGPALAISVTASASPR